MTLTHSVSNALATAFDHFPTCIFISKGNAIAMYNDKDTDSLRDVDLHLIKVLLNEGELCQFDLHSFKIENDWPMFLKLGKQYKSLMQDQQLCLLLDTENIEHVTSGPSLKHVMTNFSECSLASALIFLSLLYNICNTYPHN